MKEFLVNLLGLCLVGLTGIILLTILFSRIVLPILLTILIFLVCMALL